MLQDRALDLPWSMRLRFALDGAKGMCYLHSRDPPLVHRDLKVRTDPGLVAWCRRRCPGR